MWPPCALTLGVMLLVMQKARCCWMLSMLWQCCCLVVLRYFCRARAMDGKMACAASRGSITSPGAFFCSSSCRRLICVNASSTATTSLGRETQKTKLGLVSSLNLRDLIFLRPHVRRNSRHHLIFLVQEVTIFGWQSGAAWLDLTTNLLLLFLVSTNSWEKYLAL